MIARLVPDPFVLILVGTAILGAFLPAHGIFLALLGQFSNAAIFLLFFFHGLRLPREAVVDGLRHWKLQLAVIAMVFIAMPLLGLALATLLPSLLTPPLWAALLFLCALPSTVQAAIASSSMAGGNTPASVIAAAATNLLGVIATPLLFMAFAGATSLLVAPSSIWRISVLLLLPFISGQVARRWGVAWIERNKAVVGRLDRLTIILALYVAFSAATNDGVWGQLDGELVLRLLIAIMLLLALAFALAWWGGAWLGFARQDRITLLFAGAHKSLATGAPMARILFPAATAGLMIVPLMIYHQLQLIVSALIASRLGATEQAAAPPAHREGKTL